MDPLKQFAVCRLRDGKSTDLDDLLVVERATGNSPRQRQFTVTMRTPGHDFELTSGLLLTKGIITSESDIGQIRYCDTGEAAESEIPNIVTVQLKTPPKAGRLWQRTLMAGTSCGLCGKAALDAVGSGNIPAAGGAGSGHLPRDIAPDAAHTCAVSRRCFSRRAGCTRLAYLTSQGIAAAFSRTSGGTMRPIKPSAMACGRAGCRGGKKLRSRCW